MTKRTTEEVANKVRTEMTKEKLLEQFKNYISEDSFRVFTNDNNIIPINPKDRRPNGKSK
jgi:hypothetical protein|tara:strand:- start:305 stop:484 length:180 start_codon:yes stop_codon:yes gene_type:complete